MGLYIAGFGVFFLIMGVPIAFALGPDSAVHGDDLGQDSDDPDLPAALSGRR